MTGVVNVSCETRAPFAFAAVATARAKLEPMIELNAPVSGIIESWPLGSLEFQYASDLGSAAAPILAGQIGNTSA